MSDPCVPVELGERDWFDADLAKLECIRTAVVDLLNDPTYALPAISGGRVLGCDYGQPCCGGVWVSAGAQLPTTFPDDTGCVERWETLVMVTVTRCVPGVVDLCDDSESSSMAERIALRDRRVLRLHAMPKICECVGRNHAVLDSIAAYCDGSSGDSVCVGSRLQLTVTL